jgi:hypothetical protein
MASSISRIIKGLKNKTVDEIILLPEFPPEEALPYCYLM